MACEAWREKLDAYVDGELPAADANPLASHLRSCADCSAETLERVQLKRSVSMAGKRYQPDAEFRARIAQRVRGRLRRDTSWFWKIVLVPAMLVLLISAALSLYIGRGKSDRQRVYSELADLHVATLASGTPVDVISTDRHTVKPWFAGKIPFTFNLPELQGTDFTLLGGRVTYLEQMPGAQLIYRIRKHEISVFILQDRNTDAARSTSTPVQMLSFNIASWTQNGLRYFVIGDVGANDLESLSKLVREAK